MNQELKGNFFAIISAIFQSSVIVFWAYLLTRISKPILMTYWFGTAFIILFLYLLVTKKLSFKIEKYLIIPLIIFGLLSSLTTFLLMTGAQLSGASITSFLMQTSMIFALMYSFFALKEKFGMKEIIGITILIIGLFILNWQTNMTITITSGLILIAALSQSTNHFMAKKLLKKVPKLQLNMIRTFMIFLVGIIVAFSTKTAFQMIELQTMGILLVGVLLGPIFVYVFYYSALQKTNLATASTLRSIGPLFTLILAFIFLGEILTLQQTIFVIITLIGALLILTKK